MTMKVGTNLSSQAAIGRLKTINQNMERNAYQLSSLDRIYTASIDPAGLAISENMRSKSASAVQARRNANDGVSIFQVAEGSLNEIHAIGTRMRELAMASATDTVTNLDRSNMEKEFSALKLEVDRLATGTTYNDRKLLTGDNSLYEIQIGLHNNIANDRLTLRQGKIDATVDGLGIRNINVSTKAGAQRSLGGVDRMIQRISGGRTELGALLNRMQSTINNLGEFEINTESAKSRIRDADVAKVTAENVKLKIQRNATTISLKSSNASPNGILKLME